MFESVNTHTHTHTHRRRLDWYTITRWVCRQDSVGPAPPFFASGRPQTGVWWTKMEGEEFMDDMKIEFEPNKRGVSCYLHLHVRIE